MLFNSCRFLVFFPAVVLTYYILPQRARKPWLLLASYYFYMCWNAKYVLLILTSTIVTFLSGLFIEKSTKKSTKTTIVICSIVVNLGILGFFKYSNFALRLFTTILYSAGLQFTTPSLDILLPVGISFYTFQALSYTFDVYRGDIYAEKSFIRYALFVSFFPQLVAGPIERSKNLLKQLATDTSFNFEKARDGLLLMIWGFFLKLVIADRVAIIVDTVYENYNDYPGFYLMIGTMLFAIQIYCDFAGYSVIAIGAAEILGIRLTENFNSPYLALSVADFWRRWHISLTSWFRDYLYIPMGGSKRGKLRKYLNIMIVFMVSGLWHGASISFIIWGGLNGLYQVIGDILLPIRNKLVRLMRLDQDSYVYKFFQLITTFLFVDFAWIFFRSGSTTSALKIIESMITTYNPQIFFDGSIYTCGLDYKNFLIMVMAIIVLIISDVAKRKGIVIRHIIAKQPYLFRCLSIVFCTIIILVFGIWGSAYNVSNFIYFQF